MCQLCGISIIYKSFFDWRKITFNIELFLFPDNNQSSKSDESDVERTKHKRQDSGSGSDPEKTITKRSKALINSDSENETGDKENSVAPTADALFGDASDISTDDEKEKKEEEKEKERSRSRSRSKSKSRSRSPSRSKSRSRSRSRSRSHSRGRSESGGEGPSHRTIIEDVSLLDEKSFYISFFF